MLYIKPDNQSQKPKFQLLHQPAGEADTALAEGWTSRDTTADCDNADGKADVTDD